MIEIININQSEPYEFFMNYLNAALKKKQPSTEAICISSFNKTNNEINSRYVNLKFIINDNWIFFTNYLSQKGIDFSEHNQISATFYWHNIDVQIRIKGNIKKTSKKFSDDYFNQRDMKKNILAISSNQSKKIESYEMVNFNYQAAKKCFKASEGRPSYWGGYSFKPYYFEFWEGNKFRINKRIAFNNKNNKWLKYLLQP